MKRRHFLGITLASSKRPLLAVDEIEARRRTIARAKADKLGFPWVRVMLAVLVGCLLGWAGAVWWGR